MYMTDRDTVSKIVLETCKTMVGNINQIVSLNTKLFKELNFSDSQIITVM